MADGFAFADQLKSEFRGRGAAVSGMQATPTSELMQRAEMGEDPRANVSEEAFRENYRAHRNAVRAAAPSRPPQNQPQNRAGAGYGQGNAVPGSASRSAQAASRPGYRSGPAPHDSLSEEIAGRGRARQQRAENHNPGSIPAGSRRTPDGRQTPAGHQVPDKNQAGSRRQNPPQTAKKNVRGQNRDSGSKKRGSGTRGSKIRESKIRESKIRVEKTRAARKKAAPGEWTEEYELKRTRLPVALIVLTLVGVLIIFTLVESLAEVYQTSTDIARMKETRDALKETAEAMELKLDEKNDVRTIREIAVGELGMAEEDSMQRRFISVSGGERIELLETEDDSPKAGGVLFSSLGEYVNRFLGRFR